ncbi:MAG: amidohydrolase family protein, partial [Acidimicrobiales bacterium]
YVGIIVDRLHVHDDMVRLAWRLAADRMVLVSDAMAGLGLPAGAAELAGSRVRLDGVSARLADGTLAGSVISLRDAVANLRAVTDCDVEAAIRAASRAPSRAIRDDSRGELAVGKRADMVVVDHRFSVVATIIGGNVVYRS